MGELLFFHFRVTNVKLINEKNSLINAVQNDMDCDILLCFLYLACFVVSTYMIFILLDFNGLCKFNNIFINKITEEIQ